MKEQDKKMVLPKLDDLFTIQEQRDNPVVDEVKEIELYKIGEFPDHPFRVIDDDKMEEMVKSVKEHGVLLPVIVRKRGEGNYQKKTKTLHKIKEISKKSFTLLQKCNIMLPEKIPCFWNY